jgi:hypothetical protein
MFRLCMQYPNLLAIHLIKFFVQCNMYIHNIWNFANLDYLQIYIMQGENMVNYI